MQKFADLHVWYFKVVSMTRKGVYRQTLTKIETELVSLNYLSHVYVISQNMSEMNCIIKKGHLWYC